MMVIRVLKYFSKSTACTRAKMNPTIKYGFGVLVMRQCRNADANTHTTGLGDAGNGEGFKCVRAEGIEALLVLATQFCCEPKTALENKVYLKSVKIFLKVLDIF